VIFLPRAAAMAPVATGSLVEMCAIAARYCSSPGGSLLQRDRWSPRSLSWREPPDNRGLPVEPDPSTSGEPGWGRRPVIRGDNPPGPIHRCSRCPLTRARESKHQLGPR
jgi:hypothetical protein